jgi:hypothetical protein
MAADSRSTHTDALATLGTIINDKEKRDAIHLGVEPIQAGEMLFPGQHIGIGIDGKAYLQSDTNPHIKLVGIVDPFLPAKSAVYSYDWFWLIVYPRQITSLRHVWEHPDFPISGETEAAVEAPKPTEEQLHKTKLLLGEDKAIALQWIRDYADSLCEERDPSDPEGEWSGGTVTADELIDTAMGNLKDGGWGEYICKGGLLEGVAVSPEFWNKVAIYKGIEIPQDKRDNFFSCSC